VLANNKRPIQADTIFAKPIRPTIRDGGRQFRAGRCSQPGLPRSAPPTGPTLGDRREVAFSPMRN
jgi:hypothetical protein